MADFNIQFNIMLGLERVRKKDFINIFTKRYPDVKPKHLENQLTLINRDYNIILYHNKGFLLYWGELIHDGVNWGKYISSFNIDSIKSVATIGGNFQYKSPYSRTPDHIHAIHPNIYRKPTDLKLPSVVYGTIIKICLQYEHMRDIDKLFKNGNLYGIIQVCQNMFNIVEKGDALWLGFKFKTCPICDEQITYEQEKCKSCKELDQQVLV